MNHFETAEHYFKLNQKLSNDIYKTRLYETAMLAVYDVSMSLLQFLPHKPKMAMIRQGTATFEAIVPIFLRQQITPQFKTNAQNCIQFIESIDKETNFVLWCAENEVTGEILFSDAQCAEIHKALSDKKIFSVQLVQASRHLNKAEMLKNSYAVIIELPGIFSPVQTAQLFHTDKLKAPTLIGAFQNNAILEVQRTQVSNAVVNLTAQYQYEKLFQTTINYINDRKTFMFKNCSGQMLLQKLIEKKYLDSELVFAPSTLATWTLETFKNWWPEADKPDLILGLLVISNEAFIQNPKLDAQLAEIYKNCLSETSWSTV